jgi:integrase
MIIFAAATGLRPAEWVALEKEGRRSPRTGRVRAPRLHAPRSEAAENRSELRAVPLQAPALDALDRSPAAEDSPLVFPGERGGYLDIHHFRPYRWRIYDPRHTFATFALRAGISTSDLSRYGRRSDDDRPPLRPVGAKNSVRTSRNR